MKNTISYLIDPEGVIELLAHAIRSQMRDGYENEIGKAHACLLALGKEGYKITNANAIEAETESLQQQAFSQWQANVLKELKRKDSK